VCLFVNMYDVCGGGNFTSCHTQRLGMFRRCVTSLAVLCVLQTKALYEKNRGYLSLPSASALALAHIMNDAYAASSGPGATDGGSSTEPDDDTGGMHCTHTTGARPSFHR
jgi:hypothetical protein